MSNARTAGILDVDGLSYDWQLQREPQWSDDEGWKGVLISLVRQGSQREALLEFPAPRRLLKGLPRGRTQIDGATISRGVRAALAAGAFVPHWRRGGTRCRVAGRWCSSSTRTATDRVERARCDLASRSGWRHPTPMRSDTDLETVLLGPVLADRACGDCTACCTVLAVDTPDFEKPAEAPCGFLGARGCGIHDIRPDICRTWFCAWRRVATMPDAARPDLSGLLVSLNFVREPQNCFEAVSINVRALPGNAAIANGMAATVLDSVCDQMVPVWFSDGSKKMLMYPENDVAQLVLSGESAPPHLRDEVAAWRERYAAFLQAD